MTGWTLDCIQALTLNQVYMLLDDINYIEKISAGETSSIEHPKDIEKKIKEIEKNQVPRDNKVEAKTLVRKLAKTPGMKMHIKRSKTKVRKR